MTHTHEFKTGRSKTVAVCSCGKFKFIGDFTPIVAVEPPTSKHAPELLGALKSLVNQVTKNESKFEDNASIWAFIEDAQDVISKAEGVQS